MKFGIISDIHGNLEALNAVLGALKESRVDTILCCGDIVGYGADPQKCLDIIRKLKVPTVAGNHDWAVGGRLDYSYFTADAKAAIDWTRKQLGVDDITDLNELDLIKINDDLTLVHGTLHQPGNFLYLDDISKAAESFSQQTTDVCFVGHTHVPVIFVEKKEKIYFSQITEMEIIPEHRYIINVGSCGQPRDGNPLASYCVYENETNLVHIHRIPYDIKTAQKKILDAGLPSSLASRLSEGH